MDCRFDSKGSACIKYEIQEEIHKKRTAETFISYATWINLPRVVVG